MSKQKEKFIKLKKEGKTLKHIGAKNHLSAERVRQIISSKHCEKHRIDYYNSCKYCVIESVYAKFLNSLTKKQIMNEMTNLSKKGRDAESSLKRKFVIKKVHNEWNMSFSEIGRNIRRDRTSVSHSYYSK